MKAFVAGTKQCSALALKEKIDGFKSDNIIRLGAERMAIFDFFFLCFLCKWITDPVHLRTLVEVFELILTAHRGKTPSMGRIHEFIKKATAILNQESPSKAGLQELQTILQEISNMDQPGYFQMKLFLGTRRKMIGGTYWNPWSSGKMLCFLRKVIHWNGKPNDVRSFSHDKTIYSQGVTSDAIRKDSATLGPDFRNEIHDLWLKYGCSEYSSLSTPLNTHRSALNSPRTSVAGTTPLPTHRSALNSPRTSVAGATPLNTHRSTVGSSSSSVAGATPLNTYRSTVGSSSSSVAPATPRDHLCTAPPLPHSFVLEWFMSNGPCSLNETKRRVCPNMFAPYHPCLKELYDMVTYYQLFREAILENNPLTLAPFFQRVSKCWHIQNVLASSPFFRSLQHVAFADNEIQHMFLEGLVFSIFNEYNLPFRLGISKIVRNPDGERFSIELFPEDMIQDYIRRSQPSIIGEQASIA